jgi:hypothetical protein
LAEQIAGLSFSLTRPVCSLAPLGVGGDSHKPNVLRDVRRRSPAKIPSAVTNPVEMYPLRATLSYLLDPRRA